MILADMGAEVIKIERPSYGDDSRHFGPYVNGESAYFMSINRNKKSITINLKHEKGKEIFREMVKDADIVIENFRPGTMKRLGLGYEELRKINEKIIYAASSGFGHTGPYSERPAYDAIVQAMGGLMSITGQKDGSPTRVGSSIGDIIAGLYTTIGIFAALRYRDKEGVGQKVDISMLDGQVSILENAIARYFATGKSPKPAGNRHNSIIPFEPFETSDGELMIAAGNDNLWQKLCLALNRPSLSEDSRFVTNPLRAKNYNELRPILADLFKQKTTKEWHKILLDNGVPNGPINNIENVVNDPQVKAREMIVEVDHPKAGKVKMAGIPIKMSKSQGEIRMPSPSLGEHTEDILKRILNFNDEEIIKLREEGVL
jgi:CoA:oxalate CoA-transferase